MREIIKTTATYKAADMGGFESKPREWLSEQMHVHELTYLLAHADEGVIWGRLDGKELITSHDVAPQYSPPLRTVTLQTARIFAPAGELLVWRNEDGGWSGRLIAEITVPNTPGEQASQPNIEPAQPAPTAEWTEAFDEQQILLGTMAKPLKRDFALMSEGSQGLFHAVPLKLSGPIDELQRPLRLVVRHYLQEDTYGFRRVNASRLFDLLELKESNA